MTSSDSPTPTLNRQSCELNERGRALLQSLLAKLYPDGRPPYSDIADDAGAKRVWTSEFINKAAKGYQAGKIATFFESLEQKALDAGCDLPERFCEESHCQSYISEQAVQPQVTDQPERLRLVGSSSEQKLLEALWDLNCYEQQYHFMTHWKRCDRAALVSLHCKGGELSQRWLVKRFAKEVRGFGTAQKIPIQAGPFKPMVKDHEKLWIEIAKYLPGAEANKDAIIERLCQITQTQSVVLALYGLNTHTKRLQPLRQTVLKFWQELYDALHKRPPNRHRAQLALFLIGDLDETNIFDACTANLTAEGEFLYDLRLPDLASIDNQEVNQWIGGQGDDVYETLRLLAKEVDLDEILDEELPGWSGAPDDVLKRLLSLSGSVDLQSQWELAR